MLQPLRSGRGSLALSARRLPDITNILMASLGDAGVNLRVGLGECVCVYKLLNTPGGDQPPPRVHEFLDGACFDRSMHLAMNG